MALEEQFNRAVRWYERFRDLTHGRDHTMPSDNYVDEIYAFFQNCYHLKDWIKNDPTAPPAMVAAAEAYVTSRPALALSADLCNSQKHFTLTKTPRSGSIPTTGPKHFNLGLGSGPPLISMRVVVQSGSAMLDAFDVATAAMQDWTGFINGYGYSVQAPSPHPPTRPPAATGPAMPLQVTGNAAQMILGRVRTRTRRTLEALGNWFIKMGERARARAQRGDEDSI